MSIEGLTVGGVGCGEACVGGCVVPVFVSIKDLNKCMMTRRFHHPPRLSFSLAFSSNSLGSIANIPSR